MKKIVRGLLVAATVLLLAGCNNTQKNQQSDSDSKNVEQKITVTTGAELTTLDSALYTDVYSSDTIGAITEGLYRVDKENGAELGMAAEEPVVSSDGTVYTFKLRDTKWSNGDPVTASDFVYSFQTIVDPAYKSPSSNQMDVIKNAKAIRNGEMSVDQLGIKALDDQTVELTLENPAPYLPKLLTGTPFMPKSETFAKKAGKAYGTTSEQVVANGPFTISGWDGTNDSWTFKKNPNYWDAKNVKLNEIKVDVIKDVGTGANLFDSGKVNFTILSDTYVSQYQSSEDFHSVPKATIGYIGFNTQRATFANVHARKAVAQAFDKNSFAKNVLADGSLALNGLVPDNYAKDPANGKEFRQENGDLVVYDVKAAQAEWEQAKRELGQDTIELELLSADTVSAKKTAEFIQGELIKNLPGIEVKVKSVPIGVRLDQNRSGDFDFFFGTWTPDYADPINFLEVYESTGGLNFGKYSNSEFDTGIQEVKTTLATKPEERWETMLQLEKTAIQKDTAIAPVYQGAIAYLESPNVKGIQALPFGRQISYRLAEVKE